MKTSTTVVRNANTPMYFVKRKNNVEFGVEGMNQEYKTMMDFLAEQQN